MVGRCISYWTSPFLGDMLVFRGVDPEIFPFKIAEIIPIWFRLTVGGFKDFWFSSLLGEMNQFD